MYDYTVEDLLERAADEPTSLAIMKIRIKAGGGGPECPTCGKSLDAPYRRRDGGGHIVEGCVDAAHTGHLGYTTETRRWHDKAGPKAIRKAELAMLRGR